MFDSVKVRFALRAVVAGTLAGLAVLRTVVSGGISGEEWVDVSTAWLAVTAAYAGIGAAVPAVEPSIGRRPKKKHALPQGGK